MKKEELEAKALEYATREIDKLEGACKCKKLSKSTVDAFIAGYMLAQSEKGTSSTQAASKARRVKVTVSKDGESRGFDSMSEAAKFLGVQNSTICKALKVDGKVKGYTVKKQ